MTIAPKIDPFIHYRELRLALDVHRKVAHVTGMGSVRILKPVLLAIRIEMWTRRLKIRSLALGILVKVQRVLPWRQILEVQTDLHALLRCRLERRPPHALTFGVPDVEVVLGGCEERA